MHFLIINRRERIYRNYSDNSVNLLDGNGRINSGICPVFRFCRVHHASVLTGLGHAVTKMKLGIRFIMTITSRDVLWVSGTTNVLGALFDCKL